jgi:hypothetical protein
VHVDGGQVGHQGVELAERPGLQGLVHPLLELLSGEPARGMMLPQQRRGAVAVGVGGAHLRITSHRVPFSGRLNGIHVPSITGSSAATRTPAGGRAGSGEAGYMDVSDRRGSPCWMAIGFQSWANWFLKLVACRLRPGSFGSEPSWQAPCCYRVAQPR